MKKALILVLTAMLMFSFAAAEEIASAQVDAAGVSRTLTLTDMTVENGDLNLYFSGYGSVFGPEDWIPVAVAGGERLESWASFPGDGWAVFVFDTVLLPDRILLVSPSGEELTLWDGQ